MLNFFYKKMNNKKGFTLIELIVVIAILAILALMAIPRLSGFTEKARQSNDENAANVVCNAAALYHASNPTDATITVAELVTDQLIQSAPTATSKAYATNTFAPTLGSGATADTISVTLTAQSGYTTSPGNYVISK